MATTDPARRPSSGDHSATQAPENRGHVTSEDSSGDPALKPGGEHGVPVQVGMEALDRASVPALEHDDAEHDGGEHDGGEHDGGDAGSPPSGSDRVRD